MMSPKASTTVLVTDSARGSAVACIRSLGRAGFRVIAADTSASAAGFRSRYVAKAFVYPDPEADAGAFCDALEEEIRREGVRLVIPATDLTAVPLASQRERFAALTRLGIADDAALECVQDKERTIEIARGLGIPVPAGRIATSVEDALDFAVQHGWPIVLKPRRSRSLEDAGVVSHVVRYAGDERELRARWPSVQSAEGVILQEFYAGRGEGVEVLAQDGEPLLVFQHRRRREVPVTGGASSDRESVALDPQLVDPALRLLRALRWTGLAMVEFKVGSRGPQFMEINGRIWGSLPLAVAAGVDFPLGLAILHLDGPQRVPRNIAYRVGLRSRDLRRDLVWIGAVLRGARAPACIPVPPRRAAVRALLELLDPNHRQDLWEWRDPWPALHELPRIASVLWHKAAART